MVPTVHVETRVPAADREKSIPTADKEIRLTSTEKKTRVPEEVVMVSMPTVAAEVKVPAVISGHSGRGGRHKHTFHHAHIALLKSKEAFVFCIFRKHNIQPLSEM